MHPPGITKTGGVHVTRLRCLESLLPLWHHNGVLVYPHQLQAAERILFDFKGSGILADEVGLGKTVEAGLIMSERALAKPDLNVLILAPASLVMQWDAELRHKFGVACSVNPSGYALLDARMLLCSLDYAKRGAQRARLLERHFDLVIVDEAHHLKNARTISHQFVANLRRKDLVLLTATPIQNELGELYALVKLVKPDLFPSYTSFYRQFILDKRTPRNEEELRQVLSGVMVRQKRHTVGIHLPDRQVELLPVELTEPESRLYATMTQAMKHEYRRRLEQRQTILPLLTLQRELCSSAAALRATLQRVGQDWLGSCHEEILALIDQVGLSQKAFVLRQAIRSSSEPIIVFTEYRATLDYLAQTLSEQRIVCHQYHGTLTISQKSQVLNRFERQGGVLLATETGGQGLNLQFANRLVNYDLPWNPMRVEQRIGRVHRMGQTRPVAIINLFAQGTVEEDILHLLYVKIDLFRRVIGDLDVIIRRLEGERSFEGLVLDAMLGSRDSGDQAMRLAKLGEQLSHSLFESTEGHQWTTISSEAPPSKVLSGS